MKAKKAKKYSRLKMFSLYCLSLIMNLLPLIIVLIVNWEICTKTKREGVAISVTGFVWVAILICSMLGAMPKKVNRILGLSVFFIIIELMKPLLKYMGIFVGAALIGMLLDEFIVMPIIRRYKELRLATKTADITTQQVKEVVKELLEERNGRV